MSEKPTAPEAQPSSPQPTIHEAELASGASGAVIREAQIDFDTAVARRRTGENVVVCGDDVKTNSRLAERIEAVVGPWIRDVPHRRSAGPWALPHYKQQDPNCLGHTFYETPNRKAARKKP